MIPECHTSIDADELIDIALHHEIKCRAYELYERKHDTADGHDLRNKLKAELLRVAYAAAQLQKYSRGEAEDTRVVRAARVYLRALSSFIVERDMDSASTLSEPRPPLQPQPSSVGLTVAKSRLHSLCPGPGGV